jgi:hypothetical protein
MNYNWYTINNNYTFSIFMKCRNCSYQFDPLKEGNSRKRKCGICCFGDSYSVRSKKEYQRNLLFAMIESSQQYLSI